jgi:hypothetical protein
MRALIIDDHARAEIKRVIKYAKAHHYRKGDPVPGENENFVTKLGTYRCVFTFTVGEDDKTGPALFRHLSISIPVEGQYPHPAAAFTIATLFGFTGWDGKTTDEIPHNWAGGADEEEGCVVLIQPIEDNRTLH